LTAEVVTESQKCVGFSVDYRNGVAELAKLASQRRADTPTTNDDDVHELPS
jgi:hypothetical protein